MKKLCFLMLGFMMFIGFANANPVNIELSATVTGVSELSLTAEPIALSLPAEFEHQENDLLVGTITERTNNKAGYTVELESENGFVFYNLANDEGFVYTLKYGGNGVTLDASNKAVVTDASDKTTGTGVQKEVRISYVAEFVSPGEYGDTLTFTMILK